ncbi:hypothetical protein MM221_13125 [Salipaludibacillus sp. LMS25]|jgi:hypothetical protein|uniref:hypothetical protein n=1 Tax=Salipaludibacillus sp. LMS25 TaxID=2924031 RepID=UPI0020D08179|nr:hypothetical protein [Salipaludibacillus sp. LMS25]UTR13563.1 hypothetical protein MM221_13125 [Salipaludibacillus sp. LMS25]
MGNNDNNVCPDSCCTGDEILCLGIPCPIDIVLLGIELQVELPCIRISSPEELTEDQVQQLLGVLQSILAALGNLGAIDEEN